VCVCARVRVCVRAFVCRLFVLLCSSADAANKRVHHYRLMSQSSYRVYTVYKYTSRRWARLYKIMSRPTTVYLHAFRCMTTCKVGWDRCSVVQLFLLTISQKIVHFGVTVPVSLEGDHTPQRLLYKTNQAVIAGYQCRTIIGPFLYTRQDTKV